MLEYNNCGALNHRENCGCGGGLNLGGDNCWWIVILVAAYFFLSNGCIGNIFDQCDNNIIWIILLFVFLFCFNKNECGCGCS